MIAAVPNLRISGKKYLKPLLEMLFELPWRQIVPFEGWEDGEKVSQEIKPRTLFQESCVFLLIAFSGDCQEKQGNLYHGFWSDIVSITSRC